ncbi:MAG: hypothetical protein HC889_00690 [Synechococcaceae cyanobacterium SM1_2_3]|nr:hypothetical protein [Synechococcaceae cyanobacterium SM1_2_3]
MVAYVKFYDFAEQILKAVHDLDGTHTLKLALTNTAPAQTDTGLDTGTAHPPPTNTNGYTAGGNTLSPTLSESTGTAKLVLADSTFTASGGALGSLRYAIIYNDTATSPADALIAYYDYGSSISLADTETFTVDFDGTNGFFTLA